MHFSEKHMEEFRKQNNKGDTHPGPQKQEEEIDY
jgi:hypothetical protein